MTLLAGPQVSLTIVLTLGIAGSAASLFWVLRRWGASIGAAALGGGIYGFSPAVLNSGLGHYNLVFAVLPPLIIDMLLRLLTGRGRAVRSGIWLGLLTAAQLLISEELLADTVLASLVLVMVLSVSHPRATAHRARAAAAGLATGAAVTLLISWYPLWVQFRGPLHERNVLLRPWSGNLALFVDPSSSLLFHTSASEAVSAHYSHRLSEVLPYHWLQSLPVTAQLIPDRFCILGAGAGAAVLAFSLDLARSATPKTSSWRRSLPVAVAVLAVLPLIPLPYRTAPVPQVSFGWQAVLTSLRLAPDARVLVVPVPLIGDTAPMRWQADTGQPGSLIGGYFLGPSKSREAVFTIGPTQPAAEYLNQLSARRARADASGTALVRSALAYWRPAAVVAVTHENSRLGQFLVALLGRPTLAAGRVLAWRR